MEEQLPGKGRLVAHIIIKYVLRLLFLVVVIAGCAAFILYNMLDLACHGSTPAVKNLFSTTILETGALKWTARLIMTDEEIMDTLNSNAMVEMDAEIDTSQIKVAADTSRDAGATAEEGEEPFDINGVTVELIHGRTFDAHMIIVNDPSRIHLETSYPDWHRTDLKNLVDESNSLGGINGGIYDEVGLKPHYLTVSKGQIVYNTGGWDGITIIGFDEDNLLRIIYAGAIHESVMKKLVEENHIRDAVVFPETSTPGSSHFVKLVINGEPREFNGAGSGCNPRTAIGQRADGSVLLLVTDGRGANGHLGATAQDLIDIMMDYGAVNAANLDGGSSSAMYYEGEYIMASTTLYLANNSYPLPASFVIERRDEGNE